MERNYQKEYTIALSKIQELQELVFAYQSISDDLQVELNALKEGTKDSNIEEVNKTQEEI